MKTKILLISLFMSLPIIASAKYYPIYCKGGTSVRMATVGGDISYVMDFKKVRRKAGPRGINLKPNTCAWGDRPLRRSEPTSIVFRDYSGHRYIMINQCLNNPDCVFRVNVTNERNVRFLTWYRGNGEIRFFFHK